MVLGIGPGGSAVRGGRRGPADRLGLGGHRLRQRPHELAEGAADRVGGVARVVVAVEHGHDQAEGLRGAEHQGREPEAAAEPVAAVRPADGLDRDAGLAEDADVAPGGPLRDAELVGEPVRGDARAALHQLEGQQRPRRRARIRASRESPQDRGSRTSGTESSVPGMSDDTLLETTIAEPSMTAGEVEMLLFALERSRAQFAWKCGGLDAAGLRAPHPPSAMTLAGLIKHLALVEDRSSRPRTSAGRRTAGSGTTTTRSGLGVAVGGRRLTRGALRALARRRGAVPRGVGAGARRGRSRPAVEAFVGRASRRTSAACWSTCTTSTPATSATRTSSAKP